MGAVLVKAAGQRSSFATTRGLAFTLCACPCSLSLISLILHPYALAKAGPFTWIAAIPDSHSPPTSPHHCHLPCLPGKIMPTFQ